MGEITYMDCWHFIALLIPVTGDDYTKDVYVMVFNALNEAEKRRKGKLQSGVISLGAALKDFEESNRANPKWTPQRVKTLLLRQPEAGIAEDEP